MPLTLVFDLNGTLFERHRRAVPGYALSSNGKYVMYRNHLREFLEHLAGLDVSIGFWTSMLPENALPILEDMLEGYNFDSEGCYYDSFRELHLGGTGNRVKFVLTQESCAYRKQCAADSGFTNQHRPITFKPLIKDAPYDHVYVEDHMAKQGDQQFELTMPSSLPEFGDVLWLDDSLYKYAFAEEKGLLLPSMSDSDDVLKELMPVLDQIVSEYQRGVAVEASPSRRAWNQKEVSEGKL